MNLREFLLTKTRARELCIITDYGYVIGATYIDHEDLFINSLNPRILNEKVNSDSWNKFTFINNDRKAQTVLAHFIEIGGQEEYENCKNLII